MTSVDNKGKITVEINPRVYDTPQTIRERIAADFGVLPQLIIIPENVDSAGEIVVTNLVRAVQDNDTFSTFSQRFPAIEPVVLVEAYAYSRKELIDLSDEISLSVLAEIQQEIPELRELPSLETLEIFIKEFLERETALEQLLNSPVLESTDLVPEQVEYSAYFRAENLRWTILPEIFDRAIPTVSVPVVVMRNQWKILQGFDGFPTEINNQSSDALYAFLKTPDGYTLVRFENGEERGIKISVQAIAYAAGIAADTLVQTAINGLFSDLEGLLVDTPEVGVTKGEIYYFGSRFNADIFLDVVLNDSVAKRWFYKPDLENPGRKESGVFVYFMPDSNTKWSITLYSDNFAEIKEGKRLRLGRTHTSGTFVTAKIEVQSSSQEAFVKLAINGLLQRYTEVLNEYTDLYRQFIPDWRLEPPIKRSKLAGVTEKKYISSADERRALDPILFPNRIGRKCLPKKQPWVVLDPEEIERIKREDPPSTWLEFPRPREYPLKRREFQQWITPRMFTCRRPSVDSRGNVSYPREQNISMVRLSKPLPNPKDPYQILDLQVPVALCCEIGEGGSKPDKPLSQWKRGVTSDFTEPQETGKTKGEFTSNKIATRGRKATLPTVVSGILSAVIPTGEWKRYGVNSREGSAVEAVAMALGQQLTPQDIEAYRNSSEISSLVCSQENPGKTQLALEEEIRNGYFQPRKFYRFLEELFGVRIILFINESIEKTSPGTLYNFQGLYGEYFFDQPERPVVCLFEHMGSEGNSLDFPHTELIGHANARNATTFTFDGSIAEKLVEIREKASRFVLWSRPNTSTNPTVPVIPQVTRQVIDQFGKCRGVEINRRFFLEIPPSPAYNVPLMEPSEIPHWDRWDRLDRYGISLVSDPVPGRNPARIVVGETTMEVVLISEPVQESTVAVFQRNKRLARVLEELFFHRFSQWWETASVEVSEETTEDMIQLFADSAVVIEPDYEYPIPVSVIADNVGFYRDSRLILPSNTVKTRLMYILYRDYRANPTRIMAMKNKEFLESVYVNRHDYNQNSGVMMVESAQLPDYISAVKSGQFQLRFTVEPELTEPYFLQLDSKVYLARNFSDLDAAVESGVSWESGGKLAAKPVEESYQWDYRLYVTQEKFRVGTGGYLGGFEVLGYVYPITAKKTVNKKVVNEVTEQEGYTVVYW